ncbi:MAG: acetyltransferase [Prevotellaceae bacterium]|jgi:RimJ/RimL family protein N-acetyltransferase|nr:acetyltransferase [Prevotellaceae bacterium]
MLFIKPKGDSDIKQLEVWLNKEYILKWYHDASEWLNEIKERNDSFSFLHHFIVLKGNVSIGFCQYYDCFDTQEEWYSISWLNKVFSIDYLIGEEEYLGKGYGKQIVELLIHEIYKLSPKTEIVVQPDNDNVASCKALLANGFVYDKGYFAFKAGRF